MPAVNLSASQLISFRMNTILSISIPHDNLLSDRHLQQDVIYKLWRSFCSSVSREVYHFSSFFFHLLLSVVRVVGWWVGDRHKVAAKPNRIRSRRKYVTMSLSNEEVALQQWRVAGERGRAADWFMPPVASGAAAGAALGVRSSGRPVGRSVRRGRAPLPLRGHAVCCQWFEIISSSNNRTHPWIRIHTTYIQHIYMHAHLPIYTHPRSTDRFSFRASRAAASAFYR